MNFDVIAFKESQESERWHWQIIRLPNQTGPSGPIETTCCTEPKHDDASASACPGFDDEEAAKKDGWLRVQELEAGRVPSRNATTTVVDTPW